MEIGKPLYKYIETIRDEIDSNIELKFGEIVINKNQVINLYADIEELSKDTGFIPKIDFKEGIRKTIQFYKNNKNY